MASVSIADLTISIKDNSKQAAEKVLNLAAALEELRNKQAGSGALKTVANDIATLKSADMGGLVRLRKQLASATVYAERLATAMDKVVKASGSVKLGKISAQAAKQSVTSNSANMVTPTATEATGTTSSVDKALEKRMQAARATIQALEQQADLQRQMSGWIEESQKKYGASIPLSEKFKNAIVGVGQAGVSVFHRLLPQGMIRTLNQLGRLMKMRILRTIVRSLLAGFTEGLQNCYYWAKATGDQFASSMDTISTSMNYAKNSIGAAFSSIINIIAPVIDQLVDWLVVGINYINMFFAALSGATEYTKARKVAVEYGKAAESAIGGAAGAAKDLKEQLTVLDFDELHQLQEQQTPSTGGGGGGGGGTPATNYADMFEKAKIDTWLLDNFNEILGIIEAIGAGILAWKISSAFLGDVLSLKQQLGIALMVTGVTLEFQGAKAIGRGDATAIDYIKTAIGAALGVGGSLLTFGTGPLGWTIGIGLAITTFIVGLSLGQWEKFREELYNTSEAYKNACDTIEWAADRIKWANESMSHLKSHDLMDDEEYKKWSNAAALLEKIQGFQGVNVNKADLGALEGYINTLNEILKEAGLEEYASYWIDANENIQLNVSSVQEIIDKMLELSKLKAYMGWIDENNIKIVEGERNIEEAEERKRTSTHDLADARRELEKWQKLQDEQMETSKGSYDPIIDEKIKYWGEMVTTLETAVNDCNTVIETNTAVVEEAKKQNAEYAEAVFGVAEAAKEAADAVAILNTVELLKYTNPNKFAPSTNTPVSWQIGNNAHLGQQYEEITGNGGLNIFADPSKNIGITSQYGNALEVVSDAAEEASQSQRYYNTALDDVPRVGNAGTNTFREYSYQLGDVSTATDEARTATSDFDTVLTHVGDGVNLKPVQNKFKTDLSTDFFVPIGKGARTAIEGNINAITADGKKIYPQVSDPILKEDYAGTGSTIQTAVQGAINAIHANGKTIYDTVNSNITSKDYGVVGGTVQSKVQAKINAITADGKGIKERIGGQFTYYSSDYSKMGSDTGDTIRKGMVTGLAATTLAKGIYDGLKEAVDSAGFSWIGRAIGNYIKSGIGTALNGSELSITMKIGTSQKTYTGRVVSASLYAQGGFPQAGDLFVANEQSAEMVGSIGGRPAVVNNEQIASALARALQPMLSGNGGQQTTNVEVKLDSATIAKASMKGQRAMNRQFNITARA